jgi:hypothetical protein
MYIREVWIDNVRCFRGGDEGRVHLALTRPDGRCAGWTVVAGRNGTGKSTFLKAIALAVVGPSAARSLQETFAGWIRTGEEAAYVGAELTQGKRDIFREGGRLASVPFWADLELRQQEHEPEPILSAYDEEHRPRNAARVPGPTVLRDGSSRAMARFDASPVTLPMPCA